MQRDTRIIVGLPGVKYFVVVFICICLTTNDVEYLFMLSVGHHTVRLL